MIDIILANVGNQGVLEIEITKEVAVDDFATDASSWISEPWTTAFYGEASICLGCPYGS
jgi:hypothetical protein